MTKHKPILWEKIAGFVFGILFVCAILTLNVFIPHPSLSQQETFKIVLALSAAGFGGVLAGFLNVKGEFAKFSVRAGGALALFFVVFFLSPSTPSVNPPKKLPVEIQQTMTGNGGVQLGENSGTINISNTKDPGSGPNQKP